jgi:hypothetical protein
MALLVVGHADRTLLWRMLSKWPCLSTHGDSEYKLMSRIVVPRVIS